MIRKWVIYKLTSPSGRVYIGRSKEFHNRMGDYRRLECKNQKLIYKSLVKYGFDNHKVEIIDEFTSDFAFACGKEMFWIRTNMSNIRKFPEVRGLNLGDGGDGNLGLRHTEETKKKISEYNKLNPNRSMLGKKLSQEAKDKISKANKGRVSYRKGVISEKVLLAKEALSKREKWASLKGVIPYKAIAASSLLRKGKPSPTKGRKSSLSVEERKIKYGAHHLGNTYKRGTKLSTEQVIKMSESKKRTILQFDLNGTYIEEYDSIKEAAKLIGIQPKTIGLIAMGIIKKPKRFIFKYK